MGGNGSGGNNRKPVEQHKLEGTYRKDRHGKQQCSRRTATGGFTPPKWLSPEAKAHFEYLAPLLIKRGDLNELSLKPFELLCSAYGEIVQYQRILEKEGSLIHTPNGKVIMHPIWRAYRWAYGSYLKLAKEFYLTRSDMRSDTISPPEDEDPMDKAIREAEQRHKIN